MDTAKLFDYKFVEKPVKPKGETVKKKTFESEVRDFIKEQRLFNNNVKNFIMTQTKFNEDQKEWNKLVERKVDKVLVLPTVKKEPKEHND